MFLKEILVHVDNDPGASIRIGLAAQLAAAHDARLSGLFVRPPIQVPALAQSVAAPALYEALEKAAEESAEKMNALFLAHSRGAGLRCRWLDAAGDLGDEVIARARYSDLVVIGPSDLSQPSMRRSTGRVIFGAGVPVLMVPERSSATATGEHVLIAWNASPESIRSVHCALPILQKAETVEVVIVVAAAVPESTDAPESGQNLLEFLAEHGVSASIKFMPIEEVYGVSGSILARADYIGADLIVMGAFGRSWLREAMIGSTTNRLLSRSSAPLFICH